MSRPVEDVIAEGRRLQRRQELVVGTALAACGLAARLGIDDPSTAVLIPAYGALGLGGFMVLHGLFSVASRGTRS